MGFPGWSIALAAPYAVDKFVLDPVKSVVGMVNESRNQGRIERNDEAARAVVDNLAWANQEEDPAERLKNLREVSSDASGRPLMASTALQLQGEIDKSSKESSALKQQAGYDQDLARFGAEAKAAGQDIFAYARANPDRVPSLALQKVHNVFSTLQTGIEKEMDRRLKEQDRSNFGNIAAGAGSLLQPVDAQMQQRANLPADQVGPTMGNPADYTAFGNEAYPKARKVNDLLGRLIQDNPVPAGGADKIIDDTRQTMANAYDSKPDFVRVPSSGGKGADIVAQLNNLYGMAPKKLETNQAPKVNVSVNAAPSGDMVNSDAQAILAGQLAPSALSKRGGHDARVRAAVRAMNPQFNFTSAEANAKYATNPSNLQSRALIQGVEPLYDRLLQTGKTLGNSSIPGYNRAANFVKEQTGNADIVSFNNLRDDVLAESERVLLGSGVLSDSKYLRAVKNVNSAQSYPQLQAAVKQLRFTVKSRLEALDKQPFPAPGGTSGNRPPLSSFER